MSVPLEAEHIPLHTDADGVIRVGGTRVTLDTVIAFYQMGCTAAEIVEDFDTLALDDVQAVISYYFRHQEEVDRYLQERERLARRIRQQNEARWPPEGIRERLLRRRAAGERP